VSSSSIASILTFYSDETHDLHEAHHIFNSHHPTSAPFTNTDMQALKAISSHVTYRAASILSAGVFALWQIRNEATSTTASELSQTIVAYHGSVIEKYPGLKDICQIHLDMLIEAFGKEKGTVKLSYAEESSLLGAAVAGAVAQDV
jgi:hexokinase